jgi:excisionase family DNA binding protein
MRADKLLLKPKEAAAMLGVSERTLWTLTEDGEIPCIRIGKTQKHKRYAPADLAAWVEARRLAAAAGAGRMPRDR